MADFPFKFRALRWSTATRLSLQFTILYTSVTAFAFMAAYAFTGNELTNTYIEQLDAEAAIVISVYSDAGLEGVVGKLETLDPLNFEHNRLTLLTGPMGQRIAGNVENVNWDGNDPQIYASQVTFSAPTDLEASRFTVQKITLGPNHLILGISSHLEEEVLEALEIALITGFLATVLIGAAAGIFVGRRTERQLAGISGALSSVSAGNMGLRIPLDATQSRDLVRLSVEINSTLANLQKLVESQRQISADIAHDLKTPLQRLRQRLETLGQSPSLTPETADGVQTCVEVVDDLMGTFHAILRISQIETSNRQERFAPVNLRKIMARLEDAYEPVADEKHQDLIFLPCDDPVIVQGDEELLTQMMVNAVENSLRHCPAQSTIEVATGWVGDRPFFRVYDDGPGIPEAEMAKVLDRFYRVEKSRTTPGNGLGLSLIKAVADLHKAKVKLSSNNPGLRLAVTFARGTV
jgi:signal transduction histidine kinase